MESKESVVKRLFIYFDMIYGTTNMSAEKSHNLTGSIKIWSDLLAVYDDEVIRIASIACINKHPTFSPKIGEFVLLCKQALNDKKRELEKQLFIQRIENQEDKDQYRKNREKISVWLKECSASLRSGKKIPPLEPSNDLAMTAKITREGIEYEPRDGSELFKWRIREDLKRKQFLMNEIDLSEIKSAKEGTFNVWYKTVKNYPVVFQDSELARFDMSWGELLVLRDDLNSCYTKVVNL